MTFASPAFLGLLGLIPLVLYLHMRKHRQLKVPTTAIWRKVLESAEPRPRIRPVKSTTALWLQVLTVTLAALALAEPHLPGAAANHHVLVLDAGAVAGAKTGPEGRTSYEAAWRAWLESRPRGSGNTYSVWSVGHRTRPLALQLSSVDAVRRSLETSSHADAAADWLAAANTLPFGTLRAADVTVMSSDRDVARSALAAVTNIEEITFSDLILPTRNVGITSASIKRTDDGESWDVEVVVTVHAHRQDVPTALGFDVRFTPRGATTALPFDEATTGVTRANQARYARSLDLPGPGLLEVRVEASDALPFDDVVRFAIDPDPAPATVHVISPLGGMSPALKVLEAMGRFEVNVVDEPTREAPFPDLIVVEGAADPYGEGELAPYARLWLGSSPGAAGVDGLQAARAGTARWDRSHPAARGTNWGSTGDARALELPGHGPELLVEGAGGPIVSARAWPGGREIVSAFDPFDRSFVASDQFVSFMVDVLDWLLPPTPEVAACTVGEVCRLPWSLVSTGVSAESGGDAHWSLPVAFSVLPTRLDEVWTPERAGLWHLSGTTGQTTSIVVNPPVGVSDGIELEAPASASDAGSGTAGLSLPWRGIASVLVLLFLAVAIAEAVIAGRGKEAFLRRGALGTPGTAGRRARSMLALQSLAVIAGMTALIAPPFPLPALADWLVIVGDVDEADLPDSVANWDQDRIVRVPLVDSDGAINVERSLEHSLASVDPAASVHVVAALAASTRGQALAPGQALVDRSVTLHTAEPFDTLPASDVSAAGLFVPKTYFRGDVAELTASLHSVSEVTAAVRLYLDEDLIHDSALALEPGWSTLSLPIDLEDEGTFGLALEVSAPGDEVQLNDRFETSISVRGSPKVALFASDVERAAALAGALELQGYEVVVKPPHTMSTHPGGFVGLDAVIVMDVPAVDLARTQQEALETWVKASGGGLILLGGERSFGPGGYLETPLDQLSPLSSKVSRDAPAVAMLFVLDRSGSMQQVVDGVTRLDIAKEATLAANDLLGEGSEIAVVVFDEEARTLLPFTSSSDIETIKSALVSLVPGGGTSMVPGLLAAADVLGSSDASSKHVVVMTDGLSQPGDIETAVQSLVDLDASVSAIAIGTGSDVERVRSIARIGGGTAHTTTDFRALPSILAQEAMLLSGDPVVRETVVPRRTASDGGLMTDTPAAFPPLHGFVETTAKLDATVLLDEEQGRPLLGAWRYGAGRVISFPSHGVGPWANEWSNASEFALWWGQWLRWVVQAGAVEGLTITTEHVGDELHVNVTATSESGRPLSAPGMIVQATRVQGPAQIEEHVAPSLSARLQETSPGQYFGVLPLGQGRWDITATASDGETAYTAETSAVLSYPAVYAGPMPPDAELRGLVGLTGGSHLTSGSGWRPARRVTWILTSAWRPWLILAISLWAVFLVLRYAPGWLSLRAIRTRRAGASLATPNRTPVMPTR